MNIMNKNFEILNYPVVIFDKHANLKYKFGNRHLGQKDIM